LNTVKRKSAPGRAKGAPPGLLKLFLAFAKLAERAADDRPLLRGLRIAHDAAAARFVSAHAGSYVEFLLGVPAECTPPRGEIECRRMGTGGVTEASTIARFRFGEDGVITESTVPELAGERIDQAPGACSVVAAVLWINLHPSDHE